eukprot:4233643-Amphidinium_carterae.1
MSHNTIAGPTVEQVAIVRKGSCQFVCALVVGVKSTLHSSRSFNMESQCLALRVKSFERRPCCKKSAECTKAMIGVAQRR